MGVTLYFLVLCAWIVPQHVLAVTAGTGWKIGVIVSTTLSALIFFGILLCLFYYFVARKWIRQRQEGGGVRNNGYGGQDRMYHVGNPNHAPPPPITKDPRQFQPLPSPQQQQYIPQDVSYDKEPSRNFNHSVITTSSLGGGGQGRPQQQRVEYSTSGGIGGQSREYSYNRQTVTSSNNQQLSSAAYMGTSI